MPMPSPASSGRYTSCGAAICGRVSAPGRCAGTVPRHSGYPGIILAMQALPALTQVASTIQQPVRQSNCQPARGLPVPRLPSADVAPAYAWFCSRSCVRRCEHKPTTVGIASPCC